jgi:hypothetical protein
MLLATFAHLVILRPRISSHHLPTAVAWTASSVCESLLCVQPLLAGGRSRAAA